MGAVAGNDLCMAVANFPQTRPTTFLLGSGGDDLLRAQFSQMLRQRRLGQGDLGLEVANA